MTDVNSSPPPAGWYPDPAGSNRTRWWNGFAWSDSYGEPPAAAAVPPTSAVAPGVAPASAPAYGSAPSTAPAPAYGNAPASGNAPAYAGAPAFGGAPAYAGAPAYGGAELKAPEGTSPYTPFVWVLALLPLIGLIESAATLGSYDRIVTEALDPNAAPFSPQQLISGAIAWVVIGLTVLFGILDWRALKKAGVPNPFHWAWIFFNIVGVPVYMVGRSIVVRRRVGSGLAPMIVNLVLVVAAFVLGIVAVVLAFGAIFNSGLLPTA